MKYILVIFCSILLNLNTFAYSQNKNLKLVSVGGSITEIIYNLGSFDNVVATDLSSLYPAKAQKLKSVGYWRSIAAEGVLSLDSDAIILSEQSGPETSISQIKSSGKKVYIIEDKPSVESARKKISSIAKILNKEKQGQKLIQDMDKKLSQLKEIQKKVKSSPKVLFIYARGNKNLLVAGKDTSADSMIKMAKATNAISQFSGFKPLTSEAVVSANPDIILMVNGGLESLGGIEGVVKLPGVDLTKAGINKRIVAMDDLYLLGFTNRVANALTDLTYSFHQELKK